jgi:hypothetical protein
MVGFWEHCDEASSLYIKDLEFFHQPNNCTNNPTAWNYLCWTLDFHSDEDSSPL